MKYYKYQIKVLNEGKSDQVTLELNTSENVNNFVAKDKLNEFSYFSISDESADEFVSLNDENLGISEISESEFNEAIKNTFTYERINEVLQLDREQKAAEIKEKFESAMQKTIVEVEGVGFVDAGRKNLQDVQGILDVFDSYAESSIDFRLANNTFAKVDRSGLELIKTKITLAGLGHYQKKWQLENALLKATSFNEIANIVVEY
ncbi:MAG: hypothetical protein SPF98_04045 [Campylobacter sp.]|nr:hypothetical protein [Campylobacter sp.]